MIGKYLIKQDISTACDSLNISEAEFSSKAQIPLRTLQQSYIKGCSNEDAEKIYSTIYKSGLRLNESKAELYAECLKEKDVLLFHGSKSGIESIASNGSRSNCDFGNGFYCSQLYKSALCFIENYDFSSIYLFSIDLSGLSYATIPASLDWMLIVCYFRGMLEPYKNHEVLKKSLEKIADKDVIIAPIADNRMFQIMREFGEGNITDEQAIHALAASRLGNQVIFKTERALQKLKFLERLYVPQLEREKSLRDTIERKNVIDTKLRLAKREFRNRGMYIDEVFK